MGRLTVNFNCHHCGHCCTDVVCLPTPWDVIRVVRATGQNPLNFLEFLTPDELDGVEKSDPTWLKCSGKRYIMALRRFEKGDPQPAGCFFLDRKTRHCTIYDVRPILCRLYPFKLHEKRDGGLRGFSLHKDVGCPRHRDGVVETKPLYELYLHDSRRQDDYQDLVRVFNKMRRPGKRPEDFIDLFVTRRKKR
ncbi:MAG: YkgJ family cysteine cluster protein [bacterium]|nr:YkgJ family cysteine cluster protein [bacterium]